MSKGILCEQTSTVWGMVNLLGFSPELLVTICGCEMPLTRAKVRAGGGKPERSSPGPAG